MSPNNHIVLVPISARSHLRLLTQLALNLLTLHDSLVVTMLITSVSAPRLQQEINLQPKNLMAKMGSRFRVVSVKDDLPQDAGPYAEHEVMKGTIGPALEQILSGKGEARFATVPCLFISDVRSGPLSLRHVSTEGRSFSGSLSVLPSKRRQRHWESAASPCFSFSRRWRWHSFGRLCDFGSCSELISEQLHPYHRKSRGDRKDGGAAHGESGDGHGGARGCEKGQMS